MVLLVRALWIEASTLQLMGDYAAALARYTRIMGLAEDPATSGRLDDPAAPSGRGGVLELGRSARLVTGIPVRELFRVLDAGDRWLNATGHRDWRASILIERAMVHRMLGEIDAAVAAAEEALAVGLQHPDAPGFTLNAYRSQLGYVLACRAGRTGRCITRPSSTTPTPPRGSGTPPTRGWPGARGGR